VHQVTLDAFALGRYPVTVGEFWRFVEATEWSEPQITLIKGLRR
jgi:formylglycine-generating enzyme required for sulfatase activity